MASGRVSMRFTTDVNQANAGIRKLNAQLRHQQKEIQRLKDASKENSDVQNRGLVNLTNNLSKAALGYQAINKLLSTGNELISKRNELQEKTLSPAQQLGRAQQQLYPNLAAMSEANTVRLLNELERISTERELFLPNVTRLAGAAASSISGDPRLRTEEQVLQRILDIVEVGAPLARGGAGQDVMGQLLGGLTSAGFEAGEAAGTVIALQKQLFTTDLQSQQYALSALGAAKTLAGSAWKEWSMDQRKDAYRQMLALVGLSSQELKKTGLEMSGTTAIALPTMLAEKFPHLRGSTAIEALNWLRESQAWRMLKPSDYRGESVGKGFQEWLASDEDMQKNLERMYESLRASDAADAEMVARRQQYGVPGHPFARIAAREEARKTQEMTLDREMATRVSIEDLSDAFYGSFNRTIAQTGANWANETVAWLRGAPATPREQAVRHIDQLNRMMYYQQYGGIFGFRAMQQDILGFPADPRKGETYLGRQLYGLPSQIYDEYLETGELPARYDLTPRQRRAFTDLLDAIGRDADAEKEKLPAPGTDAGVKESNRSLKASVEMKGAGNSRGRQTEPD